MKLKACIYILYSISISLVNAQSLGSSSLENENNRLLQHKLFFGEDRALADYEESSPSFTADGKTMVFARYQDWGKKVPYIAHFRNGSWINEKLSFVDTLYNLAIAPDGNRIIYKTRETSSTGEVSRTFIVDKDGGEWKKSKEVANLFNINAGYFHLMEDGTLYLFARKPKTGIYFCKPDAMNIYSKPIWLSDNIGMEDSDSFDVLVHPNGRKLILTQWYSTKKYPERGETGMYYYEKRNGEWQRIKRLPIAYAWGASIAADGRFVFVCDGQLQFVNIKDLNIKWQKTEKILNSYWYFFYSWILPEPTHRAKKLFLQN